MVVTLFEKQTLTEDYLYRFVFFNTETKVSATYDRLPVQDLSTYPERYNEFDIDPDNVFTGQKAGQYLYTVYEVDTNTDEEIKILENGRLTLLPANEFNFTTYDAGTQYITA